MSGASYDTVCPNCGKQCNAYTNRKPMDYVELSCPYCGLATDISIRYMDLEELNEFRMDIYKMKPLKELPKQEFDF